MVSLRDGKTTDSKKDGTTPTPSKSSTQRATSSTPKENQKTAAAFSGAKSSSKKRDASHITKSEEHVEEAGSADPPTTPSRHTKVRKMEGSTEKKATESSQITKVPSTPTTPGRYGPIKPERFDVKPDIKPFKGESGHKVRKTAYEKDEEYRKLARDNEDHVFHELHVCFDKGPKGSPTYDKQGFILDYNKVADWMKPTPYNKQRMMRGMDKALEKSHQDEKAMAELFFEPGQTLTANKMFWQDRVSKDLRVPWHKIEVKHFKQWVNKGFPKAKSADYENIPDAERTRVMDLLSGASLRK